MGGRGQRRRTPECVCHVLRVHHTRQCFGLLQEFLGIWGPCAHGRQGIQRRCHPACIKRIQPRTSTFTQRAKQLPELVRQRCCSGRAYPRSLKHSFFFISLNNNRKHRKHRKHSQWVCICMQNHPHIKRNTGWIGGMSWRKRGHTR